MPTSPTDFELAPYWPEAERRVRGWLEVHHECSKKYVNPITAGVSSAESSEMKTCVYQPGPKRIVLNSEPTLARGCAAHELGHAALHLAGNDCWRDFEHDRIYLPVP
jgi:hypothetical protein